MSNLRADDLRDILVTFEQKKFGKKKCLYRRVLKLLSLPLLNAKLVRHKIIDVYKSRELQNAQSSNHQPKPAEQQHRVLSPQTQELFQPVNPCIQFEKLTFFETAKTLLAPIYCESYNYAGYFNALFYLEDSVRQLVHNSWCNKDQEYKIKIILRLVQTEIEEDFADHLPRNLSVTVNDINCKLPELYIPIEITGQTELVRAHSQNTMKITWSNEPCQYMAGVYVVHKITATDLVKTLKKKPLRKSELTKDLIHRNMEQEAGMNIDYIIATINDPLTKRRMELPSRGKDCIHLQCFDALQFLQMNELKQTWACPLCRKKVKFEDMEIDEFFLKILHSIELSEECQSIILSKDGTWAEKKCTEYSNNSSNYKQIEVFTLSDDEDIEPKAKRPKNSPTLSTHVEKTQNLMEENCTNSTENDLVLVSILRNCSTSSTSSDYKPIDTFQTNFDHSTLPLEELPSVLSDYVLPNIPNTEFNDNKPSTSRTNTGYQEKEKSRHVLCVITLD